MRHYHHTICLIVLLFSCQTIQCEANQKTKPIPSAFCDNRCGNAYDPKAPCQCNLYCARFGDCCGDFWLCRSWNTTFYNQVYTVAGLPLPKPKASPLLGGSGTTDKSITTTLNPELMCSGRCGAPYQRQKPCQCNDLCVNFFNCCEDYDTACSEVIKPPEDNCTSLSDVIQSMWDNDVNAFSDDDVTIDYQANVKWELKTDYAHRRLFTELNPKKLASPTVTAFLALLDNYEIDENVSETSTDQEDQEIDQFLDAVLSTKVMDILLDYLICKEKVADKSELKDTLDKLWFEFYSRSPKNADNSTSGFEHLIGESKKGTKLNGFHSWLSLYAKEQDGSMNYMGFVNRKEPNIVGVKVEWNGLYKPSASMFVKVSPEFDLAVYTVCFLLHGNGQCRFELQGQTTTIKSYNKDGHVATAFLIDQ